MSWQTLYRLRWLAGWMMATGTRFFWVRKAKHRDRPNTAAEGALLAMAGIGNSAIPWIYFWWRGLDRANYRLPRPMAIAAFVAGCVLDFAGNWLIWRAHADLGRNWHAVSVTTSDQALVTSGVYQFVRHPMYSGHLLWGLAQALLLQNWIAGPSAILTLIALLLYRLRGEEAMLAQRFGAEYESYTSRTGRLFPKLN
jgi:protein-S-isoprenylcysteine O-methyltransferase Ste14